MVFFFSFHFRVSFKIKKCRKQYRQWGKICFWAEHVRASSGEFTQLCWCIFLSPTKYEQGLKLDLFSFFFVPPPESAKGRVTE